MIRDTVRHRSARCQPRGGQGRKRLPPAWVDTVSLGGSARLLAGPMIALQRTPHLVCMMRELIRHTWGRPITRPSRVAVVAATHLAAGGAVRRQTAC
jgi:hypothetical protein